VWIALSDATLLHASRPVPVRAGAVLAWDAGLKHWGSARQSSGEPRISYQLEFAPASTDATMIAPSLPGSELFLPNHEERLALIAKAVLLNQPSEPRAVRYAELCDRLLQRLGRV
jgi:ectoine hydroxylase-related dioxygenase (phytanoyl-CoA dioxygenase family)